MNWKEFLKPTIGKIILFIILLLFVFFVSSQTTMMGGNQRENYYLLYPLPAISHSETTCNIPIAPPNCIAESKFNVVYLFLLVDIILWYLISCLIVYGYRRVNKK